jgi:hypothetical protein
VLCNPGKPLSPKKQVLEEFTNDYTHSTILLELRACYPLSGAFLPKRRTAASLTAQANLKNALLPKTGTMNTRGTNAIPTLHVDSKRSPTKAGKVNTIRRKRNTTTVFKLTLT